MKSYLVCLWVVGLMISFQFFAGIHTYVWAQPLANPDEYSTALGYKPPKVEKTGLEAEPIGVIIRKEPTGMGFTYVHVKVKNNSGKFINSLYIEILAYNDEIRVGMGNKIFNSINVGETIVETISVLDSGRNWNNWKYNRKIKY